MQDIGNFWYVELLSKPVKRDPSVFQQGNNSETQQGVSSHTIHLSFCSGKTLILVVLNKDVKNSNFLLIWNYGECGNSF